MAKKLGKLTKNQLRRTLKLAKDLPTLQNLSALIESRPRFRQAIEEADQDFSWAWAYDLTVPELVALLVCAMDAQDELVRVRAILRRAQDDWAWIDHAPKVRLYREPKWRIRFLTRDEARRLLRELPPHLQVMARFTLATGLRQHNVSYLRWDQVDMARAVAWIHPDEAKAGKAIGVPLNQDALDVMRQRRGEHPEYVFTYKGKPVDRCSTDAWKKALVRAGIARDFRWHDLRHTWASWHVQSGTRLQELMELGGWSCYEMVLRYAHLATDHLHAAACRIDDTFLTQRANLGLARVA